MLIAACGGGGGDDVPQAADAGPSFCGPLEACAFRGDFFAECGGGAGDAVFGCREVGPLGLQDCRWFTGGCAADGYTVSPCPAEDVCCLGGWPFATAGAPSEVAFRFVGFGTEEWTRGREMDVQVAVDGSLPARPLVFGCEGADPVGGAATPCVGVWGGPFALLFDTLVVQFPGNAASGWYPWVEVELGVPRARVCAVPFESSLPEVCPVVDRQVCASGGVVTLSRLPASESELDGLSGELDVTFPNGFRLTGEFTYTE
jgi:hypothetical protein